MYRKTITILIMAVFTAGLIMGFGGYVFATKNYNSSLSNKDKGIINRDVGNLLIDYGYGGEVVNQVTEALAVGVTTDGLRTILSGTSARSPAVVEEILAKLEAELQRLGMGLDSPVKEFTESAVSSPAEHEQLTPVAPLKQPSTEGTIKDILPSKRAPSAGDTPQARIFIKLGDLPGQRAAFGDSAMKFIQDLKAAGSDDQLKGKVRHELQTNRETLQKSAETLRQDLRANAQDLRENFKLELKNVRLVGYVVVAHGKGLRMINRYRSAIARFDHILGRLESRIEKIRIETEAQARARGQVTILTPPPSVILLIEEAKNTQALNKARLVELEAKYESLLTGENPQGIGEEAREIAKKLKSEIEHIQGVLIEYVLLLAL